MLHDRAAPTTNARTTTGRGTGRVDHRFATAASTFETILTDSPARELLFERDGCA